jgi:hypothetical protein
MQLRAYCANAARQRHPERVLQDALPGLDVYYHRPPLDPVSGKRGCFLSHVFMISKFLEDGAADVGLFFEDDLVLSPYRDEAAFRRALPKIKDMLLLGYGASTSGNWSRGASATTFPVRRFWATHAYALSRAGAQRLLPLLKWRGQDIDKQISADGAGILHIEALNPSMFYQSAGKSTILTGALGAARERLFAHNNGVTAHRVIELATVHALSLVAWLLGLLLLLSLLLVRIRGPRTAPAPPQ